MCSLVGGIGSRGRAQLRLTELLLNFIVVIDSPAELGEEVPEIFGLDNGDEFLVQELQQRGHTGWQEDDLDNHMMPI